MTFKSGDLVVFVGWCTKNHDPETDFNSLGVPYDWSADHNFIPEVGKTYGIINSSRPAYECEQTDVRMYDVFVQIPPEKSQDSSNIYRFFDSEIKKVA